MASRIYDGHHRRYNFWCINYHKNPKNSNTPLQYKDYLTRELNLSPHYVKEVISCINKKWFPITTNKRHHNYQVQRSGRILSLTDIQILLNDSLSKYEIDETALVILLISLIPKMRPKYLLQKINNPRDRITIQLQDIYDDKERVDKVNHFIQEGLKIQIESVLPKKLNTYLIQLKKRTAALLGKEKGDLINFETLQRTTCYFKKLFKKKYKK